MFKVLTLELWFIPIAIGCIYCFHGYIRWTIWTWNFRMVGIQVYEKFIN